MKWGLVGTGYWALVTHGRGLREHPDVDLVGVWGRSPERTREIAEALGIRAYADYDTFLADVDAVSFALDPEAQGRLALEAARAGKHLLLEKPVALRAAVAAAIAHEAEERGLATSVFFTLRYASHTREWIEAARTQSPDEGRLVFLTHIFGEDSPYAHSVWRQHYGGLWDLGPHALSVLVSVLGPVQSITAVGGRRDVAHLIMTHDSGATSTAELSLRAPAASERVAMHFWGSAGHHEMAVADFAHLEAYRACLDQLMDHAARGVVHHESDARFGAEVVTVLSRAQALIATPPRDAAPA